MRAFLVAPKFLNDFISDFIHSFLFQAYPVLLSIVKAGGHRGLEECQKQFKNEIWNCTLDTKHVYKELPIFVKTTLPQGMLYCL